MLEQIVICVLSALAIFLVRFGQNIAAIRRHFRWRHPANRSMGDEYLWKCRP